MNIKRIFMLHSTSIATIFIGDNTTALAKETVNNETAQSCLQKEPFKQLATSLHLKACFAQHQTHSVDGIAVTEKELSEDTLLGSRDGDFLITNLSNVGLFIKTADCLPIIIIDSRNKAVGIAHAGWKGSVQNIGTAMLTAMRKHYGTNPSDVEVYFGPSVRVCCYAVEEHFKNNLDGVYTAQTMENRNGQWYFNLPLYNALLLQQAGVAESAFNYSLNTCTICNHFYCSYRRDKESVLRQITLVSLK